MGHTLLLSQKLTWVLLFKFIILFYGCTRGTWMFPGQGLNPSHS